MSEPPFANGSNGDHGRDGRFTPGNRAAAGHPRPFARQAAALRKAFVEAVSPEDLVAIAKKLTAKAKGGDLAAIKLLLLWTLGKPDEPLWPDVVDAADAVGLRLRENAAKGQPEPDEGLLSPANKNADGPSMDYDTRKRAAMRQLVPLILAARAAEAAQEPLAPEASDFT